MVHMLACKRRLSTLGMSCVCDNRFIFESALISCQRSLGFIVASVVKLLVLYSTNVGSMLFRKDFAVLDWLDSSVVVVLMDFLIHSGCEVFVLVGLDSLMLNRGCNCFMDSGVVVARLAHELSDCCLGLVHV